MKQIKHIILYLAILVTSFSFIGQAGAVSFSVEKGATGTEESAIEASYGTGTVPNNIYNSDLSGTNTVGLSGNSTGTSGTQNQGWEFPRSGQDIDAIHFGPGIDASAGLRYYFSLDWGAGWATGPYPEGSGTKAAQGTGTAPNNVYSSIANGTNENPYPFAGPDLGIEPYTESNLDAFDLQDFDSSNSYPIYFSLDLFGSEYIDFNDDGIEDIAVGGADILTSFGDGTFSVFLTAADLGLEESDNLDALARLSDGSWLFSVDWGSQGFEESAVRLAGGSGRRPANIYRSFGDGTNYLWLSSETLGLPSGNDANEYGPNLDALDIAPLATASIPEPASMALMGIGLLGLARRFRRKR